MPPSLRPSEKLPSAPPAEALVPCAYLAHWLALLEARGVAPDGVLAGTGLTREAVDDPSGRIGLELAGLLLWKGATMAGDPSLGLELGLSLQPTSHGWLGYGLIACDSLRDAILLGEKYMLNRTMPWSVRLLVEGDTAVMRFEENVALGDPMRTLVLEIVLGGVVRLGEFMLGMSFAHPDIEFRADYPEQPYHARFHARLPRVRYEHAVNEARFPASWLERPLALREPVARREAIAALEQERRLLVPAEDWVLRARLVLSDPANGYPDLDEVATRLAVTSRTLRRHLAKRGVTFHELRDEARRLRAIALLSQSALGVDEIAAELRYADAAGFARAFTRWTGETPGAFRKRARRTS